MSGRTGQNIRQLQAQEPDSAFLRKSLRDSQGTAHDSFPTGLARAFDCELDSEPRPVFRERLQPGKLEHRQGLLQKHEFVEDLEPSLGHVETGGKRQRDDRKVLQDIQLDYIEIRRHSPGEAVLQQALDHLLQPLKPLSPIPVPPPRQGKLQEVPEIQHLSQLLPI